MLGKWFGSMKQLSTDRVRSRQKPFSFVRLALGYIPILLHGNKKTCVYPRTRTWRLTILTTFLVSWQQSAILQAKWWIQMNTGSGDRLVKILFLPPGELRSCYSHSCWWTFAPRSLMCSHILPPHLTRRLHLQDVSQQWRGMWQKKLGERKIQTLLTFLTPLRGERQKQEYRPSSTNCWSCETHTRTPTTLKLLLCCIIWATWVGMLEISSNQSNTAEIP